MQLLLLCINFLALWLKNVYKKETYFKPLKGQDSSLIKFKLCCPIKKNMAQGFITVRYSGNIYFS